MELSDSVKDEHSLEAKVVKNSSKKDGNKNKDAASIAENEQKEAKSETKISKNATSSSDK